MKKISYTIQTPMGRMTTSSKHMHMNAEIARKILKANEGVGRRQSIDRYLCWIHDMHMIIWSYIYMRERDYYENITVHGFVNVH